VPGKGAVLRQRKRHARVVTTTWVSDTSDSSSGSYQSSVLYLELRCEDGVYESERCSPPHCSTLTALETILRRVRGSGSQPVGVEYNTNGVLINVRLDKELSVTTQTSEDVSILMLDGRAFQASSTANTHVPHVDCGIHDRGVNARFLVGETVTRATLGWRLDRRSLPGHSEIARKVDEDEGVSLHVVLEALRPDIRIQPQGLDLLEYLYESVGAFADPKKPNSCAGAHDCFFVCYELYKEYARKLIEFVSEQYPQSTVQWVASSSSFGGGGMYEPWFCKSRLWAFLALRHWGVVPKSEPLHLYQHADNIVVEHRRSVMCLDWIHSGGEADYLLHEMEQVFSQSCIITPVARRGTMLHRRSETISCESLKALPKSQQTEQSAPRPKAPGGERRSGGAALRSSMYAPSKEASRIVVGHLIPDSFNVFTVWFKVADSMLDGSGNRPPGSRSHVPPYKSHRGCMRDEHVDVEDVQAKALRLSYEWLLKWLGARRASPDHGTMRQ
jgi:hypothetical protein